MDFGLFYYCQGRGVPHDQAYAEMLDQIALAETLGFGECWFAEHHFTDYSIPAQPQLDDRFRPAAHHAYAVWQLCQRTAVSSSPPTRC